MIAQIIGWIMIVLAIGLFVSQWRTPEDVEQARWLTVISALWFIAGMVGIK